MDTAPTPLLTSSLRSLPLVHRGKVRDIYEIDAQRLLILTTDRLSAFDVVLPTPIPGKGAVLTALSVFWCERFSDLLPHHLTATPAEAVVAGDAERAQVRARGLVVKKLTPLPIEAIVRGYLIGSGWKDYQQTGSVCGITLPPGLPLAAVLPQPLYTPSTKAPAGAHDENIDFDTTVRLLGRTLAEQVRSTALRLYAEAAAFARQRGLLIADTKFEFGVNEHGTLHLIDEVLTPDSSRFWPADGYRPGQNPPSFDKQFVRDWLEAQAWNKKAPGPELPEDIVRKTAGKYREAQRRLTGT